MHVLILNKKENIITLYSYKELAPGLLCIAMELAVNDLSAHIKANRNKRLSLFCIQSIATQALSGLEYLHEKDITHRDIKPRNILVTNWDQVTDTLKIKLADFGLSSDKSAPRTVCGTEGFRAPEVQYGKIREDGKLVYSYSTAVDIWALGKLLHNLLCKCDEHFGDTDRRSQATAPAFDLITKMMQFNYRLRPAAAQCPSLLGCGRKPPPTSQLPGKKHDF